MEVTTEVPQTGTKLRIDADRQFEGKAGDSVLRIAGEREGSQVFDASYVEVAPQEAEMISWLIKNLRAPTPELTDKIAREVQSTYSSQLSGRDAHQVADLAWSAIRHQVKQLLGHETSEAQELDKLAERFGRAAAQQRQPFNGTSQSTTSSQSGTGSRHN